MATLVRMGESTFDWLDDRLGLSTIAKATLFHQVPRSCNWWYVFGAATLTAFIFQIVTGVFLAFVYIPSPDHAYQSLQWISYHQLLGNVIRGIHYWGASAMVLLIFIHMTAHFLTGSYKYPRELQWLSGGVLLICTILMAFTGQLLRWNQDAYWAVAVGAAQGARFPFLGTWLAQLLTAGPVIGGQTLTRFYAIHVFLVPGLMFGLIGMHLYLVIYKGISEWPVPGKPVDPKTYWAEYQEILHTDGEPFFPVAIAKDTFFIMVCGIVVVTLAITVGAAQLGPVANPLTPANPRPDWYLIWYFALLALIPPASENYFIILFPLIGFLIIFLIPLANKGERHYARRPWAIAVVIIAAFATTVLVFEGYRSPWSPVFVGKDLNQIPTLSQTTIQSAQSPAAKRGAADMHTFGCLACHTIGNVGGLRGPNLSRVGDRLSEQQLITRIAAGGLNMPAFGNTMKPSQLIDIVKFLEEQKTPGQPVNVAGTGP